MKLIFMCGSHPRHLYIAKTLYEAGLLHALVIEQREEFIPQPPSNLETIDRENFIRHFQDRDQSEQKFFKDISLTDFQDVYILEVSRDELNSENTKKWIVERKVEMVVSYGVHKISNHMLDDFPKNAWNIHGGLSPWYRGNITLFWPFYFLQPNWAGMTIHQLTSKLDGGDIIHHSVPDLERGDGIHDVACKAVLQVARDLVTILKLLDQGKEMKGTPQGSNGKLFVSRDWKPQHLRPIYNYYNNDLIDRFLDGEFEIEEPPLVKAFKSYEYFN
ncbi:formyltransferase family protein [Bacillus sp. CGMCC 1.16607]|uniref:formyltransferase family protein n=1 Tax=Bacillus sp. CGMCC 1.16607 TaxID=3351842 RepID=UPI00363C4344